MGEMLKVGQTWTRPWMWLWSCTVRVLDEGDYGVVLVYTKHPLRMDMDFMSIKQWHRWSRKATLVKEATHGD